MAAALFGRFPASPKVQHSADIALHDLVQAAHTVGLQPHVLYAARRRSSRRHFLSLGFAYDPARVEQNADEVFRLCRVTAVNATKGRPPPAMRQRGWPMRWADCRYQADRSRPIFGFDPTSSLRKWRPRSPRL
jgi:hypothetical protein